MNRHRKSAHAFMRMGLIFGALVAVLAAVSGHTPTASALEPALREKVAQALNTLGLAPHPTLAEEWTRGGKTPPASEFVNLTVHFLDEQGQKTYNMAKERYKAGGYEEGETFTVGSDKEATLAIPRQRGLVVDLGRQENKLFAYGVASGFFRCENLVVYVDVRKITSYYDKPPENSQQLSTLQKNLEDQAQNKLPRESKTAAKALMPQIAQALQASGACKAADELLPVVVLPGVAGSQLYEDTTFPTNQLWPFAPVKSRLDLALKLDGKTPASGAKIVVGDIMRQTGTDFYGGLVKSLEAKGYKEHENLEVFPYDWRLDNRGHLEALDKLINGLRVKTGQKKVILIAHSMGGVIARDYVYSSTERAGKVDSFVTMGTPYWGSPKVFYAFLSGYKFGNPTVRQPLMKILMQNMPSGYQLLPWVPFIQDKATGKFLSLDESYKDVRFKYFDQLRVDTITPLPDFYTETKDNIWSLNKDLVESTKAFRAPVGTKYEPKPLPAGVKQYVIAGNGVDTLGYFEMRDWGFKDIFRWRTGALPFIAVHSNLELHGRKIVLLPRFLDGDGTVPMWSLETYAATMTYYVPYKKEDSTAHGDLPNSKRVQEIVGQIVQKKPPAPDSYPKTIPNDYAQLEGGLMSFLQGMDYGVDFTLYSDANLRITDEKGGGALGLNDEGVVDETLLPGTFLVIDGVEYASVSDLSRTYNVQVKGIQEGKFTLVVDIAKDGKTDTFYYPEVPVKAGTIAQLKLSPAQVAATFPDLQVSTDGKVTSIRAQVPAGEERPAAASQGAGRDSPPLLLIAAIGATCFAILLFAAAILLGGVLLIRRRRPK